ncbi:MAG: hypothetical protein CME06_14255 [Gemmatimonadetes bacterium]|nr:hypothetical protein [Gemmatimonadota bacterium]
MRAMRRLSLLTALWIAGSQGPTANAAVLEVPDDYATIQAGIDAAGFSDTVLVAPGTYFETALIERKSLVLMSEAGPKATVIDGNGAERVVQLLGHRHTSPTIEGFTIRGGDGSRKAGSGIDIDSAASIRRCVVTECRAASSLSAPIWIHSGPVTITDTRITDNPVDYAAVSATCSHNVVLERCTISDNAGPAVLYPPYCGPGPTIRSCTIVNNRSGLVLSGTGSAHIEHNIIAFNEEAGITGDDAWPRLTRNLVFGNGINYGGPIPAGPLDLHIDPLLLDAEEGYAPSQRSPAVDAGDPHLSVGGIQGPRADLGAMDAPYLQHTALAFRFEPPRARLKVGTELDVELLVTNPGSRSVDFTLLLRADGGLASPSEEQLSLAPRESWRVPITVAAPNWQQTGDYVLSARALLPDTLHLAGGAVLDLEVWRGNDTWRVPEDFPTIQSAIDAADDGDTVLVSPGTWEEALRIRRKWIMLLSTDGPDSTVILPPEWKQGIYCEDAGGIVEIGGFTVRGAVYNGTGAGISLVRTDAHIIECIVEDCQTWGYRHEGGGMALGTGRAHVEGCIVRNNISTHYGGGIFSDWGGVAIITGSLIVDNLTYVVGGGIYAAHRVEGNTVSRNSVRGVSMSDISDPDASPDLDKSTSYFGGGIAVSDSVIGNDVRDNLCYCSVRPGGEGGGIAFGDVIEGNLVVGNEGDGIGAGSWYSPTHIERNIVAFSDGSGIEVQNSRLVEVVGNILYRNRGSGFFQVSSIEIDATNNAMIENGIYGIESYTYDGIERIQHNSLHGNVVQDAHGFVPDSTQIWGDPLFFDPGAFDFRLLPDSPLIDTGDPDRIDPDGTRSDIGPAPYDQSLDAQLYLSPDREQVKPGERLFLRVMLANLVGSPRAFEIEDAIRAPSGDVSRPHRIHVVLGPAASAVRTVEWRVPLDSEIGVHEVGARAAPGVWDRFEIEVVPR